MMRSLRALLALAAALMLFTAPAFAQQPMNVAEVLGAPISASNPLFTCLVSLAGSNCITIPAAQTQNFDTDGGTDVTEIFGIALPDPSGAVAVDGNHPLPVTFVGIPDESTFTYASTTVQAIGAVAESTVDAIADGKIGAPVMTLTRFLRATPSGYLSGGGVPVTMKSDNTNNDDKTAICTGPCTVYSIVAFNHAATSAFLRCENDTAANTTPGSETAADGEPDFEIPANTTGAGFVVQYPVGTSYATALTCWIATGESSSDNTDAATDDVTVQFSRVQ